MLYFCYSWINLASILDVVLKKMMPSTSTRTATFTEKILIVLNQGQPTPSRDKIGS